LGGGGGGGAQFFEDAPELDAVLARGLGQRLEGRHRAADARHAVPPEDACGARSGFEQLFDSRVFVGQFGLTAHGVLLRE
jgi:hypothetical protein